MDLLFFVVFVCVTIFIWRLIAKKVSSKGYNKFLAHLAGAPLGLLAGFVFLAVALSIYETPERKAAAVAAEQKAAEQKKLEAQIAAEKKAEADRIAAEKKALEEANKDRSIEAFIRCKNIVENSLKAPSTADFPWSPERVFRLENQTYVVKSYVDAQNSFGAMLRSNWHCKIQYTSGDERDASNWTLQELEII